MCINMPLPFLRAHAYTSAILRCICTSLRQDDIQMHIWRNLLQQSQAGEEQWKEEKENGGKDPIGGSTKADLFLLGVGFKSRFINPLTVWQSIIQALIY